MNIQRVMWIDRFLERYSRIKTGWMCLYLFLFEAILKTIFVKFPLVELFAAQGGIATVIVAGKSWSDTKVQQYKLQYANNKQPCPPVVPDPVTVVGEPK